MESLIKKLNWSIKEEYTWRNEPQTINYWVTVRLAFNIEDNKKWVLENLREKKGREGRRQKKKHTPWDFL